MTNVLSSWLSIADDCLDFAFTWIQENNTPEEKEMQLRILFVQTVAMATARPTVESWHEPVLHRFDETHMRWVTIVLPPLWEASDENVVTMEWESAPLGRCALPLSSSHRSALSNRRG